MRTHSRTWLAVSLVFLLASFDVAWAQDKLNQKASGKTALQAAIEASNAKFTSAVMAGDATAVSLAYTGDAVVMAPNEPVMEGRAAIASLFGGWLAQMTISDFSITTTEVLPAGDHAIERGTYGMTMRAKTGGDPITDKGKYIVIWKRDADGVWKIHRDVWNSDIPMPTAK